MRLGKRVNGNENDKVIPNAVGVSGDANSYQQNYYQSPPAPTMASVNPPQFNLPFSQPTDQFMNNPIPSTIPNYVNENSNYFHPTTAETINFSDNLSGYSMPNNQNGTSINVNMMNMNTNTYTNQSSMSFAANPQMVNQIPNSVPSAGIDSSAFINRAFGNDALTNVAKSYTSQLVTEGQAAVKGRFERFIPMDRIRKYFDIDTSFVVRKLLFLLCPLFSLTNLNGTNAKPSSNYDQSNFSIVDINTPDLYIPTMSIVTYTICVGLQLASRGQFRPEDLGIQTSSTIGWTTLEFIVILIALYFISIIQQLTWIDLLSFLGYKYFSMITLTIVMLFTKSSIIYYSLFLWLSISLIFFLTRSLRSHILTNDNSNEMLSSHSIGYKRKIYTLIYISVTQPLFIYAFTRWLL
ncbi:hypothetical protein SNEBB_007277 [Seison nebaliae]|nr:hypothetical protein SNEBB_007277 [Seison nebaliae]